MMTGAVDLVSVKSIMEVFAFFYVYLNVLHMF